MIEKGSIVKGLPDGTVVIDDVKKIGGSYSLKYTVIKSGRYDSLMLSKEDFGELERQNEGNKDFSGDCEKLSLYSEAEWISCAYQVDPLYAINCSITDVLPHQVEAVYSFMLVQPKIRFLLADDTGAGKTIMTALLLKELFFRKKIQRVLIVTPGGLTKQWQEDELAAKFNLDFRLVNRGAFTSEPNVFQTSDRVVCSIDFICREDVTGVLSQTSWDMIVFDEAHKLSAYESGGRAYESKRYSAAAVLSKRCTHLLLLTATPHRGRKDTFKRLMQLIDEDIFSTDAATTKRVREFQGSDETNTAGQNKFFIRRLKEDMKDWDGNPLYTRRYTKTVSYELSSEEKHLYDEVTDYLSAKKKDAAEKRNVHVTLALQVMQRRLASSIFAIRNTLERRYKSLEKLACELQKGSTPFSRQKASHFDTEVFDIETLDEFDDLSDAQKDEFDSEMIDPSYVKYFTTATDIKAIKEEARETKRLFDLANALYDKGSEEQKYVELKKLLVSQNVVSNQNEKLVIFTEHKDTLLYLEKRLKGNGYSVATIHGGMNVDERKEAQSTFLSDEAQILICTDAAGEGINLQFCHLLINWDIPWNPNRLEQRMGRIHRYGQTQDVLVFNMVAANTREGKVLQKLLTKLDLIREQLGDDRVYDVIQDVLKGVPLESIIASVLDGKEGELESFIDRSAEELKTDFETSISESENQIAHSKVDYKRAHELKDQSDSCRLQPLYIQDFFKKAFVLLGGAFEKRDEDIYAITHLPQPVAQLLKDNYHVPATSYTQRLFFFDKRKYLDYRRKRSLYAAAHYINPGDALFDCLLEAVLTDFSFDARQGAVFYSNEEAKLTAAFLVKSEIIDYSNYSSTGAPDTHIGVPMTRDRIVDQSIHLVCCDISSFDSAGGEDAGVAAFYETSAAKILDLIPYKNSSSTPYAVDEKLGDAIKAQGDDAVSWTYENIAEPAVNEAKKKAQGDREKQAAYIREAFDEYSSEKQTKINELYGKLMHNDNSSTSAKIEAQIQKHSTDLCDMKTKTDERIESLMSSVKISSSVPEIIARALIVPREDQADTDDDGKAMMRDDEVEKVAMDEAVRFEKQEGRIPVDVSKANLGYDIESKSSEGSVLRYIEVKGRARTGDIILSKNEATRLAQLEKKAWLYVVTNCKSSKCDLKAFPDPVHTLALKEVPKDVQYVLSEEQITGQARGNQP